MIQGRASPRKRRTNKPAEKGGREGGRRGGEGGGVEVEATEQAICHESWDIVCRRFTRSTPGTEQYKRRPINGTMFHGQQLDDQLAQPYNTVLLIASPM